MLNYLTEYCEKSSNEVTCPNAELCMKAHIDNVQ